MNITMFYAWIIFWMLVIMVSIGILLALLDNKLRWIKKKLKSIEEQLGKKD